MRLLLFGAVLAVIAIAGCAEQAPSQVTIKISNGHADSVTAAPIIFGAGDSPSKVFAEQEIAPRSVHYFRTSLDPQDIRITQIQLHGATGTLITNLGATSQCGPSEDYTFSYALHPSDGIKRGFSCA